MRLLHARDGDVGDRSAGRQSGADARRHQARGSREYLPLRDLSQRFQGGACGCRQSAQSRQTAWRCRLMAQRITLKLGFIGGTREGAIVIPDDETVAGAWGAKIAVV